LPIFAALFKKDDMKKPSRSNNTNSRKSDSRKSDSRRGSSDKSRSSDKRSTFRGDKKKGGYKGNEAKPFKKSGNLPKYNDSEFMRLNKFIANAGVCPRREADTLIGAGVIAVNGKVVTELGTKVKRTDKIQINGETISLEQHRYVLLNKPKDFLTTTDDPFSRKSVTNLIGDACKEYIFPVDKLNKASSGLLLFTNDGDLSKMLAHPKHAGKKIYHLTLNKPVAAEDLKQLTSGIEVDRQIVKVDEASYVGEKTREIGIEISTGKFRLVSQMFEQMGYEIKKLDRVYYNGLTKKDLPRGRYRHLTDEEVLLLKRVAKRGH